MPSIKSRDRRFHSPDAAAYDDDLLAGFGGRRSQQVRFLSSFRIDVALVEARVEACHAVAAADAWPRVLFPSAEKLLRKVGVGEDPAADREEVDYALLDELVHLLGIVVHSHSSDFRLDASFLQGTRYGHVHEAVHERVHPAVVLGIVVVARRYFDDVHEFVRHLAERYAIVNRPAVFLVFIAADANLDDDSVSDLVPDCPKNLQRELRAVLDGAAVFVRSRVPSGGEELRE